MGPNLLWWGAVCAVVVASLLGATPGFLLPASGGAVLLFLGLGRYVDPWRRFRSPRRRRIYYSRPRYLNPGLARHEDYDTALIGTSLIEGMRSASGERILGGRWVRLPVPAGSAREIALILDVVLAAGRARRVVLAVDPTGFRGSPVRWGVDPGAVPLFLYRPGVLDSLRYLADVDTFRTARRILGRSLGGRKLRRFDPDRYGYPKAGALHGPGPVLDSFRRGSPERRLDPGDCTPGQLLANYRTHLLPRLRARPDVEFVLYLPPYSWLAWADHRRKGALEACLAFRRELFRTVAGLKHVRLFDFQARAEITADLSNYRDVIHYSPAVSDWILERIAAEDGVPDERSMAAAEKWIRAASLRSADDGEAARSRVSSS